MNGRRINEQEWLERLRNPEHVAWIASYADRFGPLGRISVLAGRINGAQEFDVDVWVMSCRAFSRRIEYALLQAVFDHCKVGKIHFDYAATERNGPLRETLTQLFGEAPADSATLDAGTFAERKLPFYFW